MTSAQIVSGTEVFACVEFRDSPSDTPEAFTINLSQAQLIGRTFSHFMPAGYVPSEPAEEPVWYPYPLQAVLNGCVRATGESPFPVAALKVETLRIDRADQPNLPQILRASEVAPADKGRVVDVRFNSKAQDAGPEDVLLVYVPAATGGEPGPIVGVAGAFEPGSEWLNPYTLLVVPALATDTAMVTMAILPEQDLARRFPRHGRPLHLGPLGGRGDPHGVLLQSGTGTIVMVSCDGSNRVEKVQYVKGGE